MTFLKVGNSKEVEQGEPYAERKTRKNSKNQLDSIGLGKGLRLEGL